LARSRTINSTYNLDRVRVLLATIPFASLVARAPLRAIHAAQKMKYNPDMNKVDPWADLSHEMSRMLCTDVLAKTSYVPFIWAFAMSCPHLPASYPSPAVPYGIYMLVIYFVVELCGAVGIAIGLLNSEYPLWLVPASISVMIVGAVILRLSVVMLIGFRITREIRQDLQRLAIVV
jgi:hypothetical protein